MARNDIMGQLRKGVGAVIVKQDERFLRAAEAQLAIWCAEDAGEHDNESEKLHRRLVEQLSDDYGLSKGTVSALVGRQALRNYE